LVAIQQDRGYAFTAALADWD
jgi:hypothetical protein